jgi:hypothetical protein
MIRSIRSLWDKLSSFLVKLVFVAITLSIALLPTWIYLLLKHFLSPEGFWQNAALLGIAVWFLGFIQLVLFIFWAIFALKLCLEG